MFRIIFIAALLITVILSTTGAQVRGSDRRHQKEAALRTLDEHYRKEQRWQDEECARRAARLSLQYQRERAQILRMYP